MNKTVSMVENHLFRRLYRTGKQIVTPYLVVYYKKTKSPYNRLGLTVTKKIGNAPQRNRARRVMKEAYRLIEKKLKPGYDIVIVGRKKATFCKMRQIKDILEKELSFMMIEN